MHRSYNSRIDMKKLENIIQGQQHNSATYSLIRRHKKFRTCTIDRAKCGPVGATKLHIQYTREASGGADFGSTCVPHRYPGYTWETKRRAAGGAVDRHSHPPFDYRRFIFIASVKMNSELRLATGHPHPVMTTTAH